MSVGGNHVYGGGESGHEGGAEGAFLGEARAGQREFTDGHPAMRGDVRRVEQSVNRLLACCSGAMLLWALP